MPSAASETQLVRILVVDDDSTFRNRLVAAFSSRQFQAQGAANAADARDLCRRLKPQRIVLDLRMPGESGLELISDLLQLSPGVQVVVLTGYGSIATALQATRRGAADYLTKPADADQILAAFDRISADRNASEKKPAAVPAVRAQSARSATSSPAVAPAASLATPSLARVEWEHIQRVLTDCDGNISQAARVLCIHRRSLQRKLSKYPPEP